MTKGKQIYIAIEGTVCAGKTTLCNNVINEMKDICVIPDYSDFAGGGKNLPSAFPSTLKEESNALEFFLKIEKSRFERYDNKKSKICLIDRSVYTLFAHCYSLSKLSKKSFFDLAYKILNSSSDVVWPSGIVFLDISFSAINSRNQGKFDKASIFIDKHYNEYFKEYFLNIDDEDKLFVIDGENKKHMVCIDAVIQLKKILKQ